MLTIKSNKFLRKKRKLLIDYNFYVSNEDKLIKNLMKRKPTFIIDYDEIKEDTVILRKVSFMEIYNQYPIE